MAKSSSLACIISSTCNFCVYINNSWNLLSVISQCYQHDCTRDCLTLFLLFKWKFDMAWSTSFQSLSPIPVVVTLYSLLLWIWLLKLLCLSGRMWCLSFCIWIIHVAVFSRFSHVVNVSHFFFYRYLFILFCPCFNPNQPGQVLSYRVTNFESFMCLCLVAEIPCIIPLLNYPSF